MQGGRANTGRVSVNLSGRQATRLSAGGQPQPIVHRPQPASVGPRRTGSVEIANVSSAELVEGTPPEPVQQSKPASPPQREVYPGQRS